MVYPPFFYSRKQIDIKDSEEPEQTKSIWKMMKEMVSLELMKDLRFLLVGISTFFQMLGFLIPYVYLIDMAKNTEWGQMEDTSFLVSIIGKSISN